MGEEELAKPCLILCCIPQKVTWSKTKGMAWREHPVCANVGVGEKEMLASEEMLG